MSSIKEQIFQWKEEFLIAKNDVLYRLIANKNAFDIEPFYDEEKPFFVEENTFLKKCISEQQRAIKETGSPIFGIVKDVLHFEIEKTIYHTPFFLASATISKNKFNSLLQIQQQEDFSINPVLAGLFSMEEIPEDSEKLKEMLLEKGLHLTIENGIWAANFHPHRFVFQKEFDQLYTIENYSHPLKNLFGETFEQKNISLSPYFLFPADESQINALKNVAFENLVLQGPPGTGKSQVIANLIGKAIAKKNNVLLTAEKPVALQVIYNLMQSKHLHHFCLLYHQSLKAKNFIHSIQNTWHFIEQLPPKNIVLLSKYQLLLQNLDFTLSRLRQKDLIGGVSFSEFNRHFVLDKKADYLHKKPTIPNWNADQLIFQQLEKSNFPLFGAWLWVKIEKLTSQELVELLTETKKNLYLAQLENKTIKEIRRVVKLNGLLSFFYYGDQRLPQKLFQPNSKPQKQFLKLFRELKSLLEKEELLKWEDQNWEKKFSLSELQEYIKALSNTNKFNIRYFLTRKKLMKFTSLNLLEGKKALENLLELRQTQKKIIETKEKLRKLEIPAEMPILEHLHYTISKINASDENDWQYLFQLPNKERDKIKNNAVFIQKINFNLTNYFDLNEELPIAEQLNHIQEVIPGLVENWAMLQKIHPLSKVALSKSRHLKTAELSIYNSHWKDFVGLFPALSNISNQDILQSLKKIKLSFEEESQLFSHSIQQQIKKQFDTYHQIIQTPASLLSNTDKELKIKLKKGKAILVKAFSKKRVFPSVRELLESEAMIWIRLLHPVFLCNSYSIAKSIPIDFQFDLGIFDEASQLPLSHIVGSVQRTQRIVICGDSQQMPPQFYFKKKSQHSFDALHFSSFYLKNQNLTYHYRSLHPALIAFSNTYFYNRQLKVLPPIEDYHPIELITTDGIFKNRKNEIEAQIVAKIITKKLQNEDLDFGLITFNQVQMEAVLHKIPPHLLDKINENTLLKTLEDVQGEQCKHLIISLGYAKNDNGNFHYHFGPLNQEQGYRRLNVLMSRAIEKITFVRSVTSSDFTISINEGVEMLRKLMLFLENASINYPSELPQNIEQKEKTLILHNPSETFENAQQLYDFYQMAKLKNWEIEINHYTF